jgi:hypothetical protein
MTRIFKYALVVVTVLTSGLLVPPRASRRSRHEP